MTDPAPTPGPELAAAVLARRVNESARSASKVAEHVVSALRTRYRKNQQVVRAAIYAELLPWALSVEPGNAELVARSREIDALRAEGKPTVPTTIGLERATNPFLRPISENLQETIGLSGANLISVFAETRLRKDNF